MLLLFYDSGSKENMLVRMQLGVQSLLSVRGWLRGQYRGVINKLYKHILHDMSLNIYIYIYDSFNMIP